MQRPCRVLSRGGLLESRGRTDRKDRNCESHAEFFPERYGRESGVSGAVVRRQRLSQQQEDAKASCQQPMVLRYYVSCSQFFPRQEVKGNAPSFVLEGDVFFGPRQHTDNEKAEVVAQRSKPQSCSP